MKNRTYKTNVTVNLDIEVLKKVDKEIEAIDKLDKNEEKKLSRSEYINGILKQWRPAQ